MVSARSVVASSSGRSRAYSSKISPLGEPIIANRATGLVTATPRTTSTGTLLASRVLKRMHGGLLPNVLRPSPRRADPRDSTPVTLPQILGGSLAFPRPAGADPAVSTAATGPPCAPGRSWEQ